MIYSKKHYGRGAGKTAFGAFSNCHSKNGDILCTHTERGAQAASVGESRQTDLEREITLENGLKVYTYTNPTLHSFFISLFVKSGSMYENSGEFGITHFFEHCAVRNINKIMGGELYKILDREGVEFNASTFSEMVQFYVCGGTHSFMTGVGIVKELFSPIVLTGEEIEPERKRIKAEIRESDDKTALSTFSNQIVHSGTSLSRSITGTATDVNGIGVKKLEEYRRRVFTKENVFLYITGNVSDEDIQKLTRELQSVKLYEGAEHSDIAPLSEEMFCRPMKIHIKNADYTMLRFNFDIDMQKVGVGESDLIYDILFSGYNSRFFTKLSEQLGICYDISGAVERYRNIGQFYFTFEVRERELYTAAELCVNILRAFKTELCKECECMKAGYVDNGYMLYDDVRDLNFTMAYDSHIMELRYPSLESRIDAYKNITPEMIRCAACEIFRKENLTFCMKGNKKKIDQQRLMKILSEL